MASGVANARTHTPVVGTTPRPRTEIRTQDMPVDLYETRETVVLRALVPGVDKRALKVAAHGSVLWTAADHPNGRDHADRPGRSFGSPPQIWVPRGDAQLARLGHVKWSIRAYRPNLTSPTILRAIGGQSLRRRVRS